MHDFNEKEKVKSAEKMVASVLRKLKKVFPRTEGNEWNLPKFHGMTKMIHFIRLFGSAINFYGGPAESHHKYFVKNPGQLTQRRITEFAKQIANRVYEGMVFEIANEHVTREESMWQLVGENKECENSDDEEEMTFSGKYELTLVAPENGEEVGKPTVTWGWANKKKKSRPEYKLHPTLLKILTRVLKKKKIATAKFNGHTEAKIRDDGVEHTFRAHPWYRGHPWYDWGLVEYRNPGRGGSSDTKTYPARIYGFAKLDGNGDEEIRAAIRTSSRPMSWEKVKKEFIADFDLGVEEKSYDFVPLTSIVSPLFVFRDVGGRKTKCFVALPKRCWSDYFDERILVAENDKEEDDPVTPNDGNASEDVSTDEE